MAQGPHLSMSSYLSYDQYVMFELNGNPEVFNDDGTSLDSFKSTNVMVIEARSITVFSGTQLSMLPGEIDPTATYNVATEISKKVARSLIVELRKIEAEGKCLAALTENHIRVSS